MTFSSLWRNRIRFDDAIDTVRFDRHSAASLSKIIEARSVADYYRMKIDPGRTSVWAGSKFAAATNLAPSQRRTQPLQTLQQPPPSFRRPCLKRYCSRNSGFTKLDRTQKLSVDWASLNARGRKERLAFTASHAPPHLPRNALLFVDKRRKAQRAPRRVRSHEI